MPKYKYTAVNEAGKNIKSFIVAENMRQFNLILKRKREYLIKVSDTDKDRRSIENLRINKKGLLSICRELTSRLSAGINIVKAVERTYGETKNRSVKLALYQVYERLQTGKNLSEAMQNVGVFPVVMVNVIKAGEMSGTLEEALKRLSTEYEKDLKIRNKVIAAMIYPCFLFIASTISVVIMFSFVLPNILELIGDMGDLNIFSKILFFITNLITNNGNQILISILIFAIILSVYTKTETFKYKFDKFKMKAPFIGKVYINMKASSFMRTLSTLFLSGNTLISSIEMAGKVINNSYLSEKLKKVVVDITNGMEFSEALIKEDVFPYSITSLVSVSEETGTIAETLSDSAEYYDALSETSIQKMTSVIEPIMIIVFGCIIMGILIGAFMPVYSMYSNIGSV